jgi:hypothetical protein
MLKKLASISKMTLNMKALKGCALMRILNN